MKPPKLDVILSDLEKEFAIPSSLLNELTEYFLRAMRHGLDHPGSAESLEAFSSTRPVQPITLPMLPAYVTERVGGNEIGSILALDLGGTNMRVCRVDLQGDHLLSVSQSSLKITNEMKSMSGFDFFKKMADFIAEFLTTHPSNIENTGILPLGFTFSFPVRQSKAEDGILLTWNKGFTVSDAVGKDVAQLLQRALDDKGLKIKVAAVVNDTVGALLTAAYKDPRVNVGVIFGTGTNAAYYEHLEAINAFPHLRNGEMVINIEWGSFDPGKQVLPCTRFDNRLDRESENTGRQIFEKMISGLYIGELVRLVLLELTDRQLLFRGFSSRLFNLPYSLDTSYVSDCLNDDSHDLANIKEILEVKLGLGPTTLTDRGSVRRVCEMVTVRAARLSGAALAAVLLKREDLFSDGRAVTVGADGSVYEHLPGFVRQMRRALREVIGELEDRVGLILAKDGSGIGAALTALVVEKAKNCHYSQ